ncbi:hypothetical protein STEG23_001566, partial [Scotinomys teguina]
MQPDRATNNGGRTMEVVAAAPRCQLLLIMLMTAMLLLGMKVSPLLVWRKIASTIKLQENIGKVFDEQIFPLIKVNLRPNVCQEEQMTVVGLSRPCTRAFVDTVKFWKQGCTGPRGCVAYERRTRYYTVYRQVYTIEHQTVFRCCPGWSRWDDEPGCLS